LRHLGPGLVLLNHYNYNEYGAGANAVRQPCFI